LKAFLRAWLPGVSTGDLFFKKEKKRKEKKRKEKKRKEKKEKRNEYHSKAWLLATDSFLSFFFLFSCFSKIT